MVHGRQSMVNDLSAGLETPELETMRGFLLDTRLRSWPERVDERDVRRFDGAGPLTPSHCHLYTGLEK